MSSLRGVLRMPVVASGVSKFAHTWLLRVAHHPQFISALWALWCSWTALAYVDRDVDALRAMIPTGSLALAWAVAAGLLWVGALWPRSGRCASWGRVIRGLGVSIVMAFLFLWSGTYFADGVIDGGSRLWVSAKQYLALMVAAIYTAPAVSREMSLHDELEAVKSLVEVPYDDSGD